MGLDMVPIHGQREPIVSSYPLQPLKATTDGIVELAYDDQSHTGDKPAAAAETQGITLEVVKPAEANRSFVLLSRRCMVERPFT